MQRGDCRQTVPDAPEGRDAEAHRGAARRARARVGTFRGRKRRCRRTSWSPRQTRLPRPQRPGLARCGRRSSGLLLTKVTLWMEHESGESLQRETRTAEAAASTRTSGGTDTGELERWEGVSREEPGHSPVCLRQGGSREAPRPPAPLTRPLRPFPPQSLLTIAAGLLVSETIRLFKIMLFAY